jgi:succinate dehydrogenase / fumarate reductase cytochrome b subunit
MALYKNTKNKWYVEKRPKNLNLLTIRLPINALVSILHRVTGCVLFMLIPLLLGLYQVSLYSESGYQLAQKFLASPIIQLPVLGLTWVFTHHLLAGIRHLVMDVHFLTTLMKARLTSRCVLVLDFLVTLFVAIKMWS